ncbi:helix-turn-helix domain-containing protein [Jeongeupia chitinilytica]|uniref:Transcriptional regulator n=1 Tax=Jeongeupia chitinilytica TaxID=1041641 RepID=A0ABQ3GZ60_9NEIS|nr:helix-turn-helix transcriptional regulator [Jeongeupia chitinilytica]GHD59799.1 transcriptional regulator [Jeongeupia chitinilytica]
MDSFGARLREERKRLGLNQDDFAAIGGVRKNAQSNYEKDERAPDAAYLQLVGAAGVDVLFVVTGEHNAALLSADERALLSAYKAAPPAVRAAALAALIAGTAPTGTTQVVHGDVGQQVAGNVTIEGGFNMGGKKK